MARLLSAVKSIKSDIMEITNPVAMKKELLKAKNYGKKIGLFCLNIHNSLLYGTVDSVEISGAEQTIIFNWHNESNQRCQSHIFLKEIDKVCISK
jgi:hypothetical protein